MRSKAFRDLNLEPVPETAAPRRPARPGGALPSPQETLLFALVPEDFALPLGSEAAGKVVCSYCAESGETVEDVRHPGWCIYVDGPLCPDIPN